MEDNLSGLHADQSKLLLLAAEKQPGKIPFELWHELFEHAVITSDVDDQRGA
jgi:hypothetical protein